MNNSKTFSKIDKKTKNSESQKEKEKWQGNKGTTTTTKTEIKHENVKSISTISTVILNVNGLKNPIKIKKLSDWIKKQDPTICYL